MISTFHDSKKTYLQTTFNFSKERLIL